MHACTAKQQVGADVTYSVLVDPDVRHTVRGRGKDFVSVWGENTSEVGQVKRHERASDGGGWQRAT